MEEASIGSGEVDVEQITLLRTFVAAAGTRTRVLHRKRMVVSMHVRRGAVRCLG